MTREEREPPPVPLLARNGDRLAEVKAGSVEQPLGFCPGVCCAGNCGFLVVLVQDSKVGCSFLVLCPL